MSNGVMLTENALKIVASNIEQYYRAKAPNGAWCISTILGASEQFAKFRADLQTYRHLIEEAAEEIENCYGRETELSEKLRASL